MNSARPLNSKDIQGLANFIIGTNKPTITPDVGSGVWNSKTNIIKKTALSSLKQRILLALGVGLGDSVAGPNATKLLLNYFANTGNDYNVNIDDLNTVSYFKNLYLQEIKDLKTYAKTLGGPALCGKGSITYDFTSAIASGGDFNGQNKDWFYAVGGFSYWSQGKITVNQDINGVLTREYSMDFHFYDRYNWDGGKSVTLDLPIIGKTKITDELLQQFHLYGLAKEFDTKGVKSINGTIP